MAYRRIKTSCEVCDEKGCFLDRHHIIPRADPRSTDLDHNLAIVCANCHRRIHASEIIIEGVYNTSMGPYLFWHYLNEPYIVREGIFFNKDGTVEIRE